MMQQKNEIDATTTVELEVAAGVGDAHSLDIPSADVMEAVYGVRTKHLK